jgi:hypothetical protein
MLSPLKGIAITLSIVVAQVALWIIMVAVGMPLSLAVVSVAAVSIAFGFIFGSALLDSAQTGSVIFMGALVFAATLPFAFIGMQFQAVMMQMFGGMVLAQMITSLLIIPALVSERKSSWKMSR